MDIRQLLPFIIVALVALVVLRTVIGAIKTSAKLLVWTIVTVAALAAGVLWFNNQNTDGTQHTLPSLSIPTSSEAP